MNPEKTWEAFMAQARQIAELRRLLKESRRAERYQTERAEHWRHRALLKARRR